ncbi:hypothetical protein ACH5BK_08710 [Arcobacter sp. YIC-80]|uniref:hypothetical protein n=1 Tax=Arcobacter sp. YIC-80 TaxID=3376683 RepID=UPI00384D2820
MRNLRQSQVINNFFTLASIIIISVTLTLYVKYIVNEPEITKEKVIPLSCEEITLTKYKVYNQELLNESLKALRKGYYRLNGSYKKAKSSNTKTLISLEKLNDLYIQAVGRAPKKDIKKYLSIEYKLIEKNSVDDKIKRKQFYSGSILTTFKADEKEIFKIFTDFRLYDDKEILNRIDCSIKVYKNNVKKL